jgi:hypothetical protein
MDAEEITRLRILLSRARTAEEQEELDDLTRLALAELRTLRLLLVDLRSEMARSTLEALEKL